MARDYGILVMRVKVRCNPALEDPLEIGGYLLDEDADDPTAEFLEAEWETEG